MLYAIILNTLTIKMLPSHDQKKKRSALLSLIEVFSPERENTSTNVFSKRYNNYAFFFLDKHKIECGVL